MLRRKIKNGKNKSKIEKQREYVEKKINGHGGVYSISNNNRIIANYIGGKNKLQTFIINIHLWLIWKFD